MDKMNMTIDIEDKKAREVIDMLVTKIETMNERTKKHTKDIQELRKRLIILEKEKKKKIENFEKKLRDNYFIMTEEMLEDLK